MAPGLLGLMVKNWKTSIVAVPTFSAALFYTYDYTVTNDMIKIASKRAAQKGDKVIAYNGQPRHITVILNPNAGKRKTKKLYSKYVEPFLHLAGIKVSLVEAESPKQAYQLMKMMSNCDGVAIVGGDGTVHEALNGFMSRPDVVSASKNLPIGIFPTGQFNSIARYLYQNHFYYRNQKEFLVQSAMRLVDSTKMRVDVLKVTPLDEQTKEDAIYAFRDLRYGKYQTNYFKMTGFRIYQHYIKPVWYRVKSLYSSEFKLPQIEDVSFTKPCEGCSRCFNRHKLQALSGTPEPTPASSNSRWWGKLAPTSRGKEMSEDERREEELKARDNPDCGVWTQVKNLEASDFRASMAGDKVVRLSLGVQGEYNPSYVVETQDIKLVLKPELDEEMRLTRSQQASQSEKVDGANPAQDKATSQEDKTVKFLIDGQPCQAQSVQISSIERAITIFNGEPSVV